MIYRIKDLLSAFDEGEIDIMGQQCNCFCMMGAGIAPLIAKRFPEMKEVDDMTGPGDTNKLGFYTAAKVSRLCGLMGMGVNFYGQYMGGTTPEVLNISTGKTIFNGLSRYEPLRHALRAFNCALYDPSTTRKFKIGLPKMGAGIAGGDWATIEQIISDELTNLDVFIYVLNHSELPDWVNSNA